MSLRLLALAMAARRASRHELDLETRRRAFDAVTRFPGANVAEIAREAGLEANHARYLLGTLAKAGLVAEHAQDGHVRYFPRETQGIAHDVHGAEEKRLLSVLRRGPALRVVLALLALEAAAPLREVASLARLAPSTVSYHLDKLATEGVVVREGPNVASRRFGLARPDEITRLLVRHPPRRDLIDAFVELWDRVALDP